MAPETRQGPPPIRAHVKPNDGLNVYFRMSLDVLFKVRDGAIAPWSRQRVKVGELQSCLLIERQQGAGVNTLESPLDVVMLKHVLAGLVVASHCHLRQKAEKHLRIDFPRVKPDA